MEKFEEVVKETKVIYPQSSLTTIPTAKNIEALNMIETDVNMSKEKKLKLYFSEMKSKKNLENSIETQNMIIDYFTEFMSKNLLCGEEEIIFMELNDEMKIKIFEKLSGDAAS